MYRVSDDLAAYLDSWADLLAANVERRIASGAEQAHADATLLQRAIDETRATLLAALEQTQSGALATRDAATSVAGEVSTLRRDMGTLASLPRDVAAVQEVVSATRRELSAGLESLRDGLQDSAYAGLQAEMSGVEQSLASARQDLEHTGVEVARANATIESLQGALASVQESIDRLPETINTSLNRDLASDLAAVRQEMEASEFATLDDMLALLDSVEIELEAGRQLVLTLGAIPREAQPMVPAGLQGAMVGAWRSLGKGLGLPDADTAQPATPLLPVDAIQRLVDGIEMTYRRLLDALSRRGVTAIEAVGTRFDPTFHEAVAFEPCPPKQDGLVLREQRRGYRTADAVVRLAHVVVGRSDR